MLHALVCLYWGTGGMDAVVHCMALHLILGASLWQGETEAHQAVAIEEYELSACSHAQL